MTQIKDYLLDRIEVDENGCWIWQRALNHYGYGVFKFEGRYCYAHREAWIAENGAIPEGKQMDHLCRVRSCCNPHHLEPVTPQINLLRGDTVTAANAAKTHCVRGHEFTPENTEIQSRPNGKKARICKACIPIRSRERRARARAAA